jgi:hypothetical protein
MYGPFGKMIYSDELPIIKNFILFDQVTAGDETKYFFRRFYIYYV